MPPPALSGENPLLEAYRLACAAIDPADVMTHLDGQPWSDALRRIGIDRHDMCRKYAWAIPSDEALDFIVEAVAGRRMVEVGAGTGYWAKLLSDRGVDVIATDDHSWAEHGESAMNIGEFFPVQRVSAKAAGLWADRVLFLCWPPYAMSMGADALKSYSEAGGDTLVYIGESSYGCTGDDEFHDVIAREWNMVAESDVLPRWGGIYDRIEVFKREKERL